MASVSKAQINFERLLHVCEKDSTSSSLEEKWRLQKVAGSIIFVELEV